MKKQANKTKKANKNTLKERIIDRTNRKLAIFLIFVFGVLFIFAAYAWFSSTLNVRVRTFNITVTKNDGLAISLDGVNFDTSVEISKEILLEEVTNIYPNNTNQWATNGLVPVSSNGITNHNSPVFNMFASSGVSYQRRDPDNGFVTTRKLTETGRKEYSYYLAFDLFFRNETDSPYDDNLYYDYGTSLSSLEEDISEEMQGLVNSARIGIVKIGSTTLDASRDVIQNLSCNNDCESIIFEPNSNSHTNLSRERSQKYGINLVDGEYFPTYAFSREGGPVFVRNSVSGSPNMDYNYFTLQNTITEADFNTPLFSLPNGIIKTRVYIWIEGQDIDSLETNSEGTDVSISLNFVKDTAGRTP